MRYLLIFVALLLSNLSFAASNKVYEYTLTNGLRLFVKVNPRAPVVISQIWYKIGSADEINGLTGISHVLEHMMFTGTNAYPRGKILALVRENGGQQNAMTTRDYTMYYEAMPADKLPLCFTIEADRMVHLNLTQNNLNNTMDVVKEEKRMRIDISPDATLLQRFYSLAFISNPYHHPTIGWIADLDHMQLESVARWYKTWYAPNNAIVVVVGDVNPQKVYELAQQTFGKIPRGPTLYRLPLDEQSHFGQRGLILHLPAKVPLLIVGYNAPSYSTTSEKWKVYALFVLNAILGTGDSSRLNEQLVRTHQIAAMAMTHYDMMQRYSDVLSIATIPTTNHTLSELEKAVFQQIKNLQSTPVSTQELARIKAQVIATQIYQQDSIIAQATNIGLPETLGLSWKVTEEFPENISKVTPQQIQSVANEYLISNNLTIAKLEPK